MPIVDSAKNANRTARNIVLTLAVLVLLGLISIGGVIYHYLRPVQVTALPTPAIYVGTDALPPGLPDPSPLFKAVNAHFDPSVFKLAALPPASQDMDQTARLAASSTQVLTEEIDSPPSAAGKDPEDTGLLICQPVVAPAAAGDLSRFGFACSDWLNLIAAGQLELGRTPEWPDQDRLAFELHRDYLDLSPQQTTKLGSMAGVTDVACGTISGDDSNCKLTYQIYLLPSLKTVGAPIILTGTTAQVDAALPEAAKAIDKSIGIPNADVPISTGLAPADMVRVGGADQGDSESDQDLLQWAQLAKKSPLAGLVLFHTNATDDDIVLGETVRTLLSQLPQNAQLLVDIAYSNPAALRLYAAANAALFKKYPGNALLAHVEVWEQRTWGSRTAELEAAERVCEDAPYDPNSWLSACQTLTNITDDTREGRFTTDMTDQELRFLNKIYPQTEAVATEATYLDPEDGHAWFEEAQAATMNSDQNLAVDCMQKAEPLDTYKPEVWLWALNIYQPKWYPNSVLLDQAAQKAANEVYTKPSETQSAVQDLQDAAYGTSNTKYNTMASNLMIEAVSRAREEVANQPNSADAHWDLAYALKSVADRSSLREATKEYRVAIHFLPNCSELHYEFGQVLDLRGRTSDEMDQYRQAVALDPFFGEAHSELGRLLKHQRLYSAAFPELMYAMKIEPTGFAQHVYLGDLYSMQSKFTEAAAQYQQATKYNYYSTEAWGSLCYVLDPAGKYNQSIAAGLQSIKVNSEGVDTNTESITDDYDTIADDYLHLKQWQESETTSQTELGMNPNDAWAMENLAEAEWGAGDKGDAIKQWKLVVSTHDPYQSPEAIKFLKEHGSSSS